MCGGYTRVCVRCGRCGSVEPRPIVGAGVCVRCGQVNDSQASACEACGTPLPKAPGASSGSRMGGASTAGQGHAGQGEFLDF